MLRRRLQMAENGNVPEWRRHLQPCEWLKTDGYCHIILNNKINTITELGGVFSQNVVLGNNSNVFGGGTTNGTLQHGVNANLINYFRCWSGTATANTIQTIPVGSEEVKFYINSITKKIQINGDIFQFTNSISNINSNLYIFASYFENYAPFLFENENDLKINNLYSNVFNLVAAYVIDEYEDNKGNLCSSGVAGMIDTLTGIFYTNDGTGVFSHGGDIEI